MSKAESGKIELHPEPYDPSVFFEYLDSVIAPLCKEKNIHFVIDTHGDNTVIPMMDTLRINQIFFNLLSNAVKFTPEGGTITYRLHEHQTRPGRLAMEAEVLDNGIGMSPEFQKHLFEPFSQEMRNDNSNIRGTGLGLAIVKKLLDLMGCTITVSSAPGQGTSFRICGEFDCVPAAGTAVQKETSAPHPLAVLAGCHVLLCEDHPLNQEIAKVLLNEKKVMVVKVLGGSNPFGVVLATLIGVPMYADIFGTVPIAEALLYKGAQLGTVLSFMKVCRRSQELQPGMV